ncbi:hypothetical protein LSCM1_01551 [Leishmania martiniquensis]|uniref:Uncharacterized protein n=1 Tax=Leishmania martiniquensis TaxID=1580590 RepID=A0A836FY42_9TRYP|nr:hypothetical protein LSCM1_01551 [Leishmania martiniquensis]
MPSTSEADSRPSRSPRWYPVLFQSQAVRTPTSHLRPPQVSHQGESIELSALLELDHGQVYLHLTCRSREATVMKDPVSTPLARTGATTTKQPHFASSHSPVTRRSFSVPLTERLPHESIRDKTLCEKKHKHAEAVSTLLARAPPYHLKWCYTVALEEILPVAVQRPLSAELRSRLQLDLQDEDAFTYSSHSTPRAALASLAGVDFTGMPSTPSSGACPLPSRSPPIMSSRTRDSNLSARPASSRHAASTATTYGQYLDVAEPFRSNVRSPPSPRPLLSSKGMGGRQSSSSAIDADVTTACHSSSGHTSLVTRESGSRLLTPRMERKCAPRTLPETHLSRLSPDTSTPSQTHAMGVSLGTAPAVGAYEELLSVTFSGVVERAGMHSCSLSNEERDEGREESNKRLRYRKLPRRLHRFVLDEKKGLRRSHSARTVSTTIDAVTDAPKCSATPLQSPQGKQWPRQRSHHAAWSSVLASAAHASEHKAPDLPLALEQASTFCLRFVTEGDLRAFLSCYVSMRRWAAEAEEKEVSAAASRRGHGTGNRSASGRRLKDGNNSVSSECEAYRRERAANSLDSPSTAAYNECPHDAESFGPRGSPLSRELADGLLSDFHLPLVEGSGNGREGDKHAAAKNALSTPVRAASRSRDWQDYVRHATDIRYRIAYATVPLFLWYSFLPLASSVLFTCQRGFLIVERLSPPCSPVYSPNGTLNASGAECDTAAEASPPQWRDIVCRLLAPIRTLLEVAPPAVPQRTDAEDPPPIPQRSVASWESSATPATTRATSDGVALVLPSADSATCQPTEDDLTTFKDVFLCLSESHLLFLNSFGRLRFHFSFDEIAFITHSAATGSFPAHPFIRFRLKSSGYFGTPTFVLTFVLIPDVPRLGGIAHAAALPHAPESAPTTQNRPVQRRSPASEAPHAVSCVASRHSLGVSVAATHNYDGFLEDKEKQRLLRRHQALLDSFETVCPRPLDRCTFNELMGTKNGEARNARLRDMAACASAGAFGTHPAPTFSNVRASAFEWGAHHHKTDLLLCIRIDAGDIRIAGPEGQPSKGARLTAAPLSQAVTRISFARQSTCPAQVVPSGSPTSAFSDATLRWSREDPGIVLRDAGHDMDFSFERAARPTPLLASKEAVSQHFSVPFRNDLRRSVSLTYVGSCSLDAKDKKASGVAKDSEDSGTDETYLPMAPTKRCSSIVRRAAMKGR